MDTPILAGRKVSEAEAMFALFFSVFSFFFRKFYLSNPNTVESNFVSVENEGIPDCHSIKTRPKMGEKKKKKKKEKKNLA